jgi:hypothetical protein
MSSENSSIILVFQKASTSINSNEISFLFIFILLTLYKYIFLPYQLELPSAEKVNHKYLSGIFLLKLA